MIVLWRILFVKGRVRIFRVFLFANKLILQQKPLVWLLQTHLREIDGGCIVFTDEDWETEFHWENVLEDDFKDGTESFLDDWAVAGPLATMNFMASLYSGKRIDLLYHIVPE